MNKLLNEIQQEYEQSNNKYPLFHSTHEGYAVIAEEVDELWDLVRQNKDVKGNEQFRKECIQIAAMAVKFIRSLC